MIRPITHKCGERLGYFDNRGHLLDVNKKPIQPFPNAWAIGVIFLCPKCRRQYKFNGREAVKTQGKLLHKFEVDIDEASE